MMNAPLRSVLKQSLRTLYLALAPRFFSIWPFQVLKPSWQIGEFVLWYVSTRGQWVPTRKSFGWNKRRWL